VRFAHLLLTLALPALLAAGCASTGGADPPPDPEALRVADAKAAALFAKAEALRDGKDFGGARDLFGAVHEDYPSSPLAGEAQYQEAECAFADGSYFGAGELFAKYVEARPLSPHVQQVERRLYAIGEWLIEDGKRGLLGLPIFTTSDQGVNLLRKLQVLLPTGALADDALMRLGRWHAENRGYVEAEHALDDLLKTYPTSEWRLEARFLLAWCYRRDNRGPEYDGEKLRRARAHYLAYVEAASADPERAAEVRERIDAAKEAVKDIDADLARKALAHARLYRRSGNPRAAVFVLRSAVKRWGGDSEPGMECARLADELSREIEAPPAKEETAETREEGGS